MSRPGRVMKYLIFIEIPDIMSGILKLHVRILFPLLIGLSVTVVNIIIATFYNVKWISRNSFIQCELLTIIKCLYIFPNYFNFERYSMHTIIYFKNKLKYLHKILVTFNCLLQTYTFDWPVHNLFNI